MGMVGPYNKPLWEARHYQWTYEKKQSQPVTLSAEAQDVLETLRFNAGRPVALIDLFHGVGRGFDLAASVYEEITDAGIRISATNQSWLLP